jgi:hypothetical protein
MYIYIYIYVYIIFNYIYTDDKTDKRLVDSLLANNVSADDILEAILQGDI